MSKSDLEKFPVNRAVKQNKPFIDKDLQLCMPNLDETENVSNNRTKSIYLHYTKDDDLLTPEMKAIENELDVAMNESKSSYQVWKRLKDQIKKYAEKAK